jgi:hypothetical protein
MEQSWDFREAKQSLADNNDSQRKFESAQH